MIETAVQIAAPWPVDIDWADLADRAVKAAVGNSPYIEFLASDALYEVSVKLTDDGEVQSLNKAYRHKDKPTNVLSFPLVQDDLLETVTQNSDDGEVLLGDIVLALGVCVAEAEERGIDVRDHASHLIVHGTFHLLGYDHMVDGEADAMEALETTALATIGIRNPYRDSEIGDLD